MIVWPCNLSCKLKWKGGDTNNYVAITGTNRTVLAAELCRLPSWLLACLTSSLRQKNIKTSLPVLDLPGGFLNVNVSEVSFDEIHRLFSKDVDIEPGGHWRPKDCKPRWKVRRMLSWASDTLRCLWGVVCWIQSTQGDSVKSGWI